MAHLNEPSTNDPLKYAISRTFQLILLVILPVSKGNAMRILLATDGSEGSLDAARFLSHLGHHQNVHIHLITALDNESPQDGSYILDMTQKALGTFAGHVTHATFRSDSTSEIVDGILWTAEYIQAGLIVVGARGRSALKRFLLGSVAEAVARHATVPVLVGRQQPPLLSQQETEPLRTEVIIGIDGSRSSYQAALFAATSFPLPPDCLLRLESVVQPAPWDAYPQSPFVQVPDPTIEREVADHTKHAEEVLSGIRQKLEGQGHPVTTEIAYGAPAKELVNQAIAHDAGMIVVGSRGLTGIECFLLGSVSDRLLWHSPCSVLVYRQSPDIEIV